MGIRIYALVLVLLVVGSSAHYPETLSRQRRNNEDESNGTALDASGSSSLTKRETDPPDNATEAAVDSSTPESTTSPTTVSNDASPSTKAQPTTIASKSSTSANTPKSPSTSASTPTAPTTSASTAKPDSTTKSTRKAKKPSETGNTDKAKDVVASRSSFESPEADAPKPEASTAAPKATDKKDAPKSAAPKKSTNPAPSSRNNSPVSAADPNFAFPGSNSVSAQGPNYAYTSTRRGPGNSVSSSSGSFASSGSYPNFPGFPTFNARGGFPDNAPAYNNNPLVFAPQNTKASENPSKPFSDGAIASPNAIPYGNQYDTGSSYPTYGSNNDYPRAVLTGNPNYAWNGPNAFGNAPAGGAPVQASAGASSHASAGASTGVFDGGYGASNLGMPVFSSRNGFVDAAPVQSFPDNSANNMNGGAAIDIDSDDDFSFPNIGIVDPYAFHQQMMERHFRNMQSMFGGAGFGQGFSSNNANVHSASSSISLGPDGGFQRAAINPVGPGVESRFAEELPAPSGNNVGVFSSSRSSVVVGPDGKTVAHKSATTGVNDNGRIYSRTVEE